MRAARVALAAFVTLAPATAGDPIPKEEYRARREALGKSLAGGVTVLFGRSEKETGDLRSGFAQEPNFLYLSGWRQPGAVLVIAPPADGSGGSEVLFLPPRDPKRERYTGPKSGADDEGIRELTGFAAVLPLERLEAELSRLLENRPRIYTLSGDAAWDRLPSLFPLREVADAREAIGRLRLKKSPKEVELIQRSIDATIEAHRAAWKRTSPGTYEYQAAAAIVGTYLDRGCERSAYAPIIASGPNATVLHYSANSRRMTAGDLVIMDAGAECGSYAADITRTVPVNGKFTARQRELYEIVLGAQKAVIAAVKPGMTFERDAANGLTQIAIDYMNSRGKDRHGKPLGEYFTHKTGHHVGLEVHDAGAMLTYGPLEAGMVITVEPGLYIPEEGIGIRIEDMLVVTEDGAKVLSGALPKEPDAIERALAR